MNVELVAHKIELLYSVSTETPTKFQLAQNIVNKLSLDWSDKNLKFCDPVCGRGTFLLALFKRLSEAGHCPEHIVKNMLYGYDFNRVQAHIAFKALKIISGVEPNVFVGNTLTGEFNMKFDVIVGNPPFQAPKKGDYSYWARFVDKSYSILKDDGHLAMIIPAGWMSPTNDIRQGQRSVMRDIFSKSNTTYINIDPSLGKKYFPKVGQKFTWFVLQKGQYHQTELDFGDIQLTVDLSKMPMLAKETDSVNVGIIQKICSRSRKWNFTRYIMPETWDEIKFDQDLQFKYARINGNSNHIDKVCYSEFPCRLQKTPKVVLPYNGSTYKFIVDNGKQGCTNAYVMELDSTTNIKSAETYFNSKLISWLGKNKFTQYNEGALINSVSAIDLSQPITDEDIYQFYKLTKAEREYIEKYA